MLVYEDIQKYGANAREVGKPKSANPYQSIIIQPANFEDTLEEWQAKHAAWEIGWDLEDAFQRMRPSDEIHQNNVPGLHEYGEGDLSTPCALSSQRSNLCFECRCSVCSQNIGHLETLLEHAEKTDPQLAEQVRQAIYSPTRIE